MSNSPKSELLAILRERHGAVEGLPGSNSLFRIGDDAARIYFRYSRVHSGRRTFFGLRQIDLRQLEGHNSFLCFLVDDGSLPVFVPFADFEETFRSVEPSSDGQFKVQIVSQSEGRQLYIARRGRFGIEGYVGFDALENSIRPSRLRPLQDMTHWQVQTLLASLGNMKGMSVWVPDSDTGRIDWSLTKRFSLAKAIPAGFEKVAPILSEIDVVWVNPGSNQIEAVFEVEHSTPVYSGLLRFNDVYLTEPSVTRFHIVSNETRRDVFSRQVYRPTFRKSGLSDLVSFLEYRNVQNWHTRIAHGARD